MLRLKDLSVTYPSQNNPILDGFEAEISPGERIALVSPNGKGKTTLLNLISGVIPVHISASTSGSVSLNNTDITSLPLNERLIHLSYQMADPDTQFFFPFAVHELSFAPENLGRQPEEINHRIIEAAELFGITSFLKQDASTLSTGQKKLLLWAICEVIDAPLVLLDEPCSGISPAGIDLLIKWLNRLSRQGKIVILAEHDRRLIESCTRIIEL
ncbi:MAG TPA: ABC transporter ATP-binding protein [Candidatus Cloacimonadota bacterium]|nr:ABC transporter ATP-binding protein [Candidatus Cloacimonadota bacterium]HPS38717.1 ABC transporter ATP-binding protein [Candidatus Cloacimonadota bacterium]